MKKKEFINKSISENLENAYNSLEDIGIDLTGVNKNISNLSAQIESIYPDLPKITETAAEISLNNTKKGKMELSLKGNTIQNSTQGKQLFDYQYSKNYNNTIYDSYRFIEFKNLKANTQYTFYNYNKTTEDNTFPIIYITPTANYNGIENRYYNVRYNN